MKAYIKDIYTAKNSIIFSNYIRNVPIENDEIMVLFGVTYLYTNIPVVDTLIKGFVNNDNEFIRKMDIPKGKLK